MLSPARLSVASAVLAAHLGVVLAALAARPVPLAGSDRWPATGVGTRGVALQLTWISPSTPDAKAPRATIHWQPTVERPKVDETLLRLDVAGRGSDAAAAQEPGHFESVPERELALVCQRLFADEGRMQREIARVSLRDARQSEDIEKSDQGEGRLTMKCLRFFGTFGALQLPEEARAWK